MNKNTFEKTRRFFLSEIYGENEWEIHFQKLGMLLLLTSI